MDFIQNFFQNAGLYVAIAGASLAVGLACAGSGKGIGSVGEAAAGVLSEDPSKFASCLILQILPGTQGLYGLVVWFYALFQWGVISGTPMQMTLGQGIGYCFACLPIGIGGLVTAYAQGRCAAAACSLIVRRPDQMSKGIILAIMVEFYAILCLLASFLMLLFMS